MQPTEYLFDAETLTAMTATTRAALKANTGKSDLLGFGLSVVDGRLRKDPRRYLDYGPYWWALKDALRRNGYQVGDDTDEVLATAYRGADDAETLVAAEAFRDDCLATRIIGERRYQLDGSGDWWTLLDDDMESRANG
jgi:hypothetical protein